MSRRNKGVSRSSRALAQSFREDAKRLQTERELAIMREMVLAMGGLDLVTQHRLALHVMRSIEDVMVRSGMEVPEYIEHRVVGSKSDLERGMVLCRRCIHCKVVREDATGKVGECQEFMHRDGIPLMTCSTDGCMFGIERPEFGGER